MGLTGNPQHVTDYRPSGSRPHTPRSPGGELPNETNG